jgi:hypothetical protein
MGSGRRSGSMHRIVFRRMYLAVLAVSLVAVAGSGCTDTRHQDRFKWKEFVAAAIESKKAADGPVYFDVVRVMPFEWEKLYMFPPHTPIEEIEKVLGFGWRTANKTRINEREDITLLVFVIGRTVHDYIEQPRDQADFSRLRAGHAYTPREGYFEVVGEEEDGRTVYYFVEAERYPKP